MVIFVLGELSPFCPAVNAQSPPDLSYVFLIQNSGWMEPFYSDDRSGKFDKIVAKFIERVTPDNAQVVVASFNRAADTPGRASPDIVYQGPLDARQIGTAISNIQLAHKVGGGLANSDYHEAVINAIVQILHARSALIFMVTNNKSAPIGSEAIEDSQVAARTEAFNALLKDSDSISRVVAWPVPLAVQGRFHQNGLVIYGIAYGAIAAPQLKRSSESVDVRSLMVDPPVRLKPLELDPLLLTLTPGQRDEMNWYGDASGNIYIDGMANGGEAVRIQGALTNTHYPYVIRQARLVVRWTPRDAASASVDAAITPDNIVDLAPFASLKSVAIDLRVMSASRKRWFDDHVNVPGILSIQLHDLKLALAPDFVRKMHALFGNGAAPAPDVPDQLPPQTPRIFLNYANVTHGVTQVPLTLGVRFFPWPLIGLILAIVVALVPLAALAWYATRERSFLVMIDGEATTVGLRPFQSKKLMGIRGEFRVSRGFFGSPVVKSSAPPAASS
jgi:hypothetical protein